MEKTSCLAIILIIIVLGVWFVFVMPRISPKPIIVEEETPDTTLIEEEEPTIEEEKTLPATAIFDTIETSLVSVVLSNVGGSIVEYSLKEYNHFKGGIVQLIPPERRCITDVITMDGKTYNLKDSIYTIKDRSGNSITYSLSLVDNREIIKRFTFSDTDYVATLSIDLPELESFTIAWDGGLLFTEKNQQDELRFFSAIALSDGDLITNSLSSVPYEGEIIPIMAVRWVGIKNKYFLASIIPEDIETKSIKMRRFSKSPPRGGGCIPGGRGCSPTGGTTIDPNEARMGIYLTTRAESQMEFKLFVGPIDYQLLTSYGYGLENAAYMGWKFIKPISRGILFIINSLARFIPNYGLVIIVFALIITFIFYPITMFNQKTMKKTTDIQPKLKALQKKYKKDPQRLNKETMELYKKSGVNPVSGCLPLLVQMPIFFALYAILQTTIGLRGAEFFGWLKDLSQPDPYFILPIVMGITMFFQQRIMGTQAVQGESQRMFGYMMPVFLTFIFISLPSGIVLYWLSYNVFNIAQLSYIKRKATPTNLVNVKQSIQESKYK
ncbi:YidC/Oxa1 family insertase periplasmic-domain containing protein [candidate division WOR-3 bacterium]|nr:YidC/Oxa1 family insertase periplasmic-domain containing protein [candidate division WOR-3 bacterium]